MLTGAEGCEGAGDITGEVDAVVCPVVHVSGGESHEKVIGVLSGNQNDPKSLCG